MTEPAVIEPADTLTLTCEWCSREFTVPVKSGPKPRYCKRSHRQRAYEARRLAKLLGGGS